MNIPLDKLYHYIENIAQEIYGNPIVIYRFWPHGSKNIDNLKQLHNYNWYKITTSPIIWCNDQEPLDHEFYSKHIKIHNGVWGSILKSINLLYPVTNLNYRENIFEKNLLLHSEKRSNNLKKYQLDNRLIPVYYWSHAVIAREWFRYAEHETFKKCVKKTFLIYNRAWSGTREYRLKFSDLLIKHKLINHCQTNCNIIDPNLNTHYSDYTFKNAQWQPEHALEEFLHPTIADASSSAEFNTMDYNATDIEIVLETLFDDDRLHLTEKSLRPIACAQPFILAGTHGSLEYLRSYGFKTFSDIWDESYDQIIDPKERLTAIVNLMQHISTWDELTKKNKLLQAQTIADYNQKRFFSQNFFDIVINELKTNLKLAFNNLDQCNNYKSWIIRHQKSMTYPKVIEFLKINQDHSLPTVDTMNQVLLIAQTRLATVANKNKS
jgi:hypothetical protein